MEGQCRLFKTSTVLRESHIYPAFAVDYLRKTGSRYLRNFQNPNVRQQDGIKKHLLSHDAEQRFSIKEKWFAEKIFTPYLDDRVRNFDYDENLFYFGISFLWRILILHTEFTPQLKEDWCYPKILEVENEWRLFLSKYQFPKSHSNLQLFLTDRVKSINAEVKGFDYYISRALDGTIITSSDKKYIAIYGKFLRFVFWSAYFTYTSYLFTLKSAPPFTPVI